jgi:hypothetical protein
VPDDRGEEVNGELLGPADLDPWDQQPKEGPEAFQAFSFYRDAGDERSIRGVAAALGKSATLIARWSSTHGWVGRIRAWNHHSDRIKQRAFMAELEKMASRQAQQGAMVQGLGMQGIQHYVKRWRLEVAKAEQDPEYEPYFPLNPDQVLRFVEVGMRMERVARGEPDVAVEHRMGGDAVDENFRVLLQDPGVKSASRELVRRAGAARAGESRRLGPGDEPEIPAPPAP